MEPKQLTAGVFIFLLAIGTLYVVLPGEEVYYCEDRNIVGLCDRLSKKNAEGLQTRCYYNESTNQFKTCSSGWVKYKDTIEGNITTIPDGVELDFSINKKKVLQEINISDISVSKCKKIDDIFCEVKLKDYGLNKDIKIKYNGLSEGEIYEEIEREVLKLLDKIYDVQVERNKKQSEYLTNEFNIIT